MIFMPVVYCRRERVAAKPDVILLKMSSAEQMWLRV
jgi:hypothetical protein